MTLPPDATNVVQLTDAQLKQIVSHSVRETLLQLGVDTEHPLEMQRDFQHLRDWRLAVNSVRSKNLLTMTGIIVTGVIALLWIGFREHMGELLSAAKNGRP